MEDNTQNTTPKYAGIKPNKDGGTGAFVGSLIIIMVIILGGIYVFNSIQEQIGFTKTESAATGSTETGTKLNEQDDVTSLEADLNGSDIDNLDKELDAIDAEFENI